MDMDAAGRIYIALVNRHRKTELRVTNTYWRLNPDDGSWAKRPKPFFLFLKPGGGFWRAVRDEATDMISLVTEAELFEPVRLN